MACDEIVKKRLSIIAKVIDETGYTKKRSIIKYIHDHPEYSGIFKGLSERRFFDIISFNSTEEVIDNGHKITGRSILKDSEGKKVMEWVKTSTDRDSQLEGLKIAVDELKKGIVPIKPTKLKSLNTKSKLCNQYTVTDYHIGLMAWAEESGTEWSLDIAEKLIMAWFTQAIDGAPKAEQAIFANIGDFLHWDGLDAVTPTSGHVLDADTRFQHIVRVSIRVIKNISEMLLKKYKKVHLIMAEGNHDLASSAWLREVFSMYFEKESRLTVDVNPDPYYCFKWGDVTLFYHHSHKKNLKALDSVFVSKFKKEYGSSKISYCHTGHYHHTVVLESNLMLMEQHPTLAAKDAHATRGGYHSVRNAKVITYHKEHGEVGRLTISPDMIK